MCKSKWKSESTKSTRESESANINVSIEEKRERREKVKVLAPRCKLRCPPNKSPPGRVLKPHKISELGYLKR